MSRSQEEELLNQLTWSDNEYELAEFLEKHTLPQLVRIEEGYYGNEEVTSLASGQWLVLHDLQTARKFFGKVCSGRPLTISSDCPAKVFVHPSENEFEYHRIKAGHIKEVYPKIRYLLCLEGHYVSEEEHFEKDDIFEIKAVDWTTEEIEGENVVSNQKLSLSSHFRGIFVPLLDYKERSVAEARKEFGLPLTVSFKAGQGELSRSLSELGRITLLKEIEETVVVSTTVGDSETEGKFCSLIPKDMDITVCTADMADESYARVVKLFHRVIYLNKYDSSLEGGLHSTANKSYVTNVFDLDLSEDQVRKYTDAAQPPPPQEAKHHSAVIATIRNMSSKSLKYLSALKRSSSEDTFGVRNSEAQRSGARNSEERKSGEQTSEVQDSGSQYSQVRDSGVRNPRTGDTEANNSPIETLSESPKPRPRSRPSSSNDTHQVEEDAVKSSEVKNREEVDMDKMISSSQNRHEKTSKRDETDEYIPKAGSVHDLTHGRENCIARKPRANNVRGDQTSVVVNPAGMKDKREDLEGDGVYEEVLERKPVEKDVYGYSRHDAMNDTRYQSPASTTRPFDVNRELPKPPTTAAGHTSRTIRKTLSLSTKGVLPKTTRTPQETKSTAQEMKTRSLPNRPLLSEHDKGKRDLQTNNPSQFPSKSIRNQSPADENAFEYIYQDYEGRYERPEAVPTRNSPKVTPRSSCNEARRSPADSDQQTTGFYTKMSRRFPEDLTTLTVEDVGKVLADLGLGQYVHKFRDEMIDGDMLTSMDMPSLQSLDMELVHSMKLTRFIKGYRPNEDNATI